MRSASIPSRRAFLATAGSAITIGVAGCSGGDSSDGSSDGESDGGSTTTANGDGLADSITVATFGGSYGEALKKAYFDTFQEEYGVTVNQNTADIGQLITKLKSGTASDVHWLDVVWPAFYTAYQNDVWQPYRRENLPDIDRLKPAFQPDEHNYNPGDDVWMVPVEISTVAACYNEDEMSRPTTWDDMYTDQTRGELAFYNTIDLVVGIAGLHNGIDLNNLEDNYESNMQTIWETVRMQDEYVFNWYDSPSTMNQLLASGEAVGGTQLDARVASLRESEGVPVHFQIPEGGSTLSGTGGAIPSGVADPHRKTAEMLSNWTMREEPSHIFAEHMSYAQPVEFDDLPSLYEDHPVLNNFDRLVDWHPDIIQNHREEWQLKFQQIIG